MILVDTHNHIYAQEFDTDREAALERSRQAGVEHLVIVGNDHVSNQDMMRLLPLYADHKITLGVHPHHIQDWNSNTIAWIEDQVQLPQLVGIGETGLDYFRNPHEPLAQEKVMRAQIELALKYNLIVVFHIRDAFADAKRIISEYPSLRFVIHCFTGSSTDVEWITALGGYISLSGIITFPNAKDLQEATKSIPGDRLLLETDSPYLSPGRYRGQRCEPAFISVTYQKVAEIRSVPVEELANQILGNAKTIFGFSSFATR